MIREIRRWSFQAYTSGSNFNLILLSGSFRHALISVGELNAFNVNSLESGFELNALVRWSLNWRPDDLLCDRDPRVCLLLPPDFSTEILKTLVQSLR